MQYSQLHVARILDRQLAGLQNAIQPQFPTLADRRGAGTSDANGGPDGFSGSIDNA